MLGFLAIKTFLKNNSKLIFGLIFAAMLAALMYLAWDYGNVSSKNDSLEETNTRLTNQIESFKNEVERQSKLVQDLRETNSQIDMKYNRSIEKLNNLKSISNEDIEENRTQVEKDINEQSLSLQNEFLCATGDISKC